MDECIFPTKMEHQNSRDYEKRLEVFNRIETQFSVLSVFDEDDVSKYGNTVVENICESVICEKVIF